VTQTNCGAVQIKLLVYLVEVTCREVIGPQDKVETQLRWNFSTRHWERNISFCVVRQAFV